MRTNRNGVTENSEFKINPDKLKEGLTRVFGESKSPFCDKCEKRHSYCECGPGLEETDQPKNDPSYLKVSLDVKLSNITAHSREEMINRLQSLAIEFEELPDAYFEESGRAYLSNGTVLEIELC